MSYRRFVADGIGAETIWAGVRAQSILGEDDFMEGFVGHVEGKKRIPEIPKSQRFMNRPDIKALFGADVFNDTRRRNELILKAVEEYGYTQREVADYLGMHFTSVSRIMRGVMPRK